MRASCAPSESKAILHCVGVGDAMKCIHTAGYSPANWVHLHYPGLRRMTGRIVTRCCPGLATRLRRLSCRIIGGCRTGNLTTKKANK